MSIPFVRSIRAALVIIAILSVSGCATQPDKVKAIRAVNEAFQKEYEAILTQNGTRKVSAVKSDAFDAMRIALARLGFQAESQDLALGYLSVVAPSPRPLDAAEWQRVTDADLPLLRQIARDHVGMMAEFLRFEPEGLQTVITATVLVSGGGSEVSLTMRMREIAPPPSGMPRREYAPPTAVRMGLDKIWSTFDQEMRLRAQR